ncbi:phosphopentomutase [Levilactobacillus senmaizukei DSM 21775 = NBRC 103853]|uniref:Phosphopentomutase n=1 Tax=Levilactobacillus senmaizukei DSM 21775 = NBRC 103853 TaxID=1423803 RepID=A0A0R2DFY2_9LACO|nr:phosphopentomutase [Levilactobacillus senmaizukei]KRN02930.1 phosphopentomutase [Levilactobacillus senmaizukei DSM 21775 = NBRC 103853]
MAFHRIFVIDFAGLGLGEAPEANRFQSVGADTIGHVAAGWTGQLNLPTFQELGLGNIRIGHELPGIAPVDQPTGFFGRLHMQATGNHPATGLREMWDYTGAYRTESVLDTLPAAGYPVTVAGPFLSYLQTQRRTRRFQLGDNRGAFRVLFNRLNHPDTGLTYVMLPDFRFAARQHDVQAFGDSLIQADQYLGQVLQDMAANDLLIVTATQASDPVGTMQPTREYLPLIVASSSRPRGHALGIRRTLADVGATVLENYGLAARAAGHSFLNELTQ